MSANNEAPPSYDFSQSHMQGCPPQQGLPPMQGCPPQQGPPPMQGYRPQQGGLPMQGYPPQQGRPPMQGNPQQQGEPRRYEYTPNQEFPPRPISPLQQDYGQAPVQQNYTSHRVDTQVLVNTSAAPVLVCAPPPRDYMCSAILVCLFCCWPIGICAIIKANQAQNDYADGDIIGARSNAATARQLIIASVVIGAIMFAMAIGVNVYLSGSTEY